MVEFPGIIGPTPPTQRCWKGARLAREHRRGPDSWRWGAAACHGLLPRRCRLAARYEGDVWEDFWAAAGRCPDAEPLPLGVVVTAAGTGSECNGGAVITHEEKKVKTGPGLPRSCNPRFALMDPTYTYLRAGAARWAPAGFDILCAT